MAIFIFVAETLKCSPASELVWIIKCVINKCRILYYVEIQNENYKSIIFFKKID